MNEKIEDFNKAKIFDPVKVLKNIVTHAISTASIIILSEALIADAKEK